MAQIYTMTNQTAPNGPAVEYYVLTSNAEFKSVVYWLLDHNVPLDIHLNRTRFSLDPGTKLFTEFMLRWSTVCRLVDANLDLATGLPLEYTLD